MKKIFSLVLAITMLIVAIPVIGFAEEYTAENYNVEEGVTEDVGFTAEDFVPEAGSAEASMVNIDEVVAVYMPDLTGMSNDAINKLSDADVDAYFERAFGVSADSFTADQKETALVSVAKFQDYMTQSSASLSASPQAATATSTKSSYATYEGEVGIGWARDMSKSPLKLLEALTATYILYADYYTRDYAGTIIAAGSSEAAFELIISAVGTTAISTAVNSILVQLGMLAGWQVAVGTFVVSVITAASWGLTNALYQQLAYDVLESLFYPQYMMKSTYMVQSGRNVIISERYIPGAYSPTSPMKWYDIPNPSTDKYGFWTPDVYQLTTLPAGWVY